MEVEITRCHLTLNHLQSHLPSLLTMLTSLYPCHTVLTFNQNLVIIVHVLHHCLDRHLLCAVFVVKLLADRHALDGSAIVLTTTTDF